MRGGELRDAQAQQQHAGTDQRGDRGTDPQAAEEHVRHPPGHGVRRDGAGQGAHEQRHLRPSAEAAHEVAIVLVEDLDGAS